MIMGYVLSYVSITGDPYGNLKQFWKEKGSRLGHNLIWWRAPNKENNAAPKTFDCDILHVYCQFWTPLERQTTWTSESSTGIVFLASVQEKVQQLFRFRLFLSVEDSSLSECECFQEGLREILILSMKIPLKYIKYIMWADISFLYSFLNKVPNNYLEVILAKEAPTMQCHHWT